MNMTDFKTLNIVVLPVALVKVKKELQQIVAILVKGLNVTNVCHCEE